MHWFISQFPELDHLEAHQRAQLLRGLPWWTYPLILAAAVIPSLPLGALTTAWLAMTLRSGAAALFGIPVAVATAAGLYVYQLSRVRRVMRREIAEAFRGERLPFCFKCGYNLRDSDAPHCPECGSPVRGGAAM